MKPRARRTLRSALLLAALLGAAVLLRAWGLAWGLPHAGRFYPYHPDESVLLHAISSVNPLWGDVAPTFYNYGSFQILLTSVVYSLLLPWTGWQMVPRMDLPFAAWVADFAHLLLLGRWLTVLFGAGCVWATLALGRRLFSERAGWFAALFVAVAPLPVLLSHYLTVDIPATFLSLVALLLAARALDAAPEGGRSAWGWLGAGAFVAGLATGTKYSAAAALVPLALPLWRWARAGRPSGGAATSADLARLFRRLIPGGALLLAAATIGFLFATPGALLEPQRFEADVRYELGRNQTGQGLIFRDTPPAALYHLGISLPIGMEWPLYALALAGVFWSLRRRQSGDLLLGLFLVAGFLPLLGAERKFLRYVAPLVPPLLLLAGRFLDEALGASRAGGAWAGGGEQEMASRPWEARGEKREDRRPGSWRWAVAAWGVAAGAAALASTVAHLGVLAAPDARDRAAAWLAARARPTDLVALGADPWYYTPPLHPTTGCVKVAMLYGGPPVWELPEVGHAQGPLRLAALEWCRVLAPTSLPPAGALPVVALHRYRPRFVVLTDYEYEDPERIRRRHPDFQHGVLRLEAALREEYVVAQEFRPRPSLFGFTWWRRGIPPHDWRYYMPTVRIYERRERAAALASGTDGASGGRSADRSVTPFGAEHPARSPSRQGSHRR